MSHVPFFNTAVSFRGSLSFFVYSRIVSRTIAWSASITALTYFSCLGELVSGDGCLDMSSAMFDLPGMWITVKSKFCIFRTILSISEESLAVRLLNSGKQVFVIGGQLELFRAKNVRFKALCDEFGCRRLSFHL